MSITKRWTDNAYTNVLARWNIRRALAAWDWLKGRDAAAAESWVRG